MFSLLRLVAVLSTLLLSGLPASAQLDMTGTLGQPCFDDGGCAFGLSCNIAGLCENCGGPGEAICNDGTCDTGWVPIGAFNEILCGRTEADPSFLGNCGSAGFVMCPDTNYCWGASVPANGTRFCAACGLLGQRCCGDDACREPTEFAVCVVGRCVPPVAGDAPARGTVFEDRETPEPAPTVLPVPGLDHVPPVLRGYVGLHDCSCFSTDGRNGTCRENGCLEPENFSGTCVWECRQGPGEGVPVRIRGRDGVRLE